MGGNIYVRASGTNDRLYFKSGLNFHRLSEEDLLTECLKFRFSYNIYIRHTG